LLQKLIILLHKSHFRFIVCLIKSFKLYGHNNSALCNNLEHLQFTRQCVRIH